MTATRQVQWWGFPNWDFSTALSLAPWMALSRATTGLYRNSAGNVASAAVDVTRLDYAPGTNAIRGLLMEPMTSNLVVQSKAFSASGWTDTAMTVTGAAATGPDGVANSASKIAPTTANTFHALEQNLALPQFTTWVMSAIVKAAGYNYFSWAFGTSGYSSYVAWVVDLTTGTVSNRSGSPTGSALVSNAKGSIFLGNGWYHVWANFSIPSGIGAQFYYAPTSQSNGLTGSYAGDGTSGCYLYGVQIEPALSTSAVPSSLVQTTTAAVQRAPDLLTFNSPATYATYTFDDASTQGQHKSPGICTVPVNMAGTRRLKSITTSADPSPAAPSIFTEMNIGVDLDQVIGLGVLMQLCAEGSCKLIGYNENGKDDKAAPMAATLLRHGGFGHVPVGAYQGSTGPTFSYYSSSVVTRFGSSSDVRANYPDAVTNARTVLAAQPDNSVTIVEDGFFINLYNLMLSSADSISPLTGMQLLAAKVSKLIIVAGYYPGPGVEYNMSWNGTTGVQSAYVINNWPGPTPIIGMDYNLGHDVGLWATIYNDPLSNPYWYASSLWPGLASYPWCALSFMKACGLYDADFTNAHANGTNTVNTTTGSNTWTSTAGNFTYLGNALSNAAMLALVNAKVALLR